jgi:hypothetical protein
MTSLAAILVGAAVAVMNVDAMGPFSSKKKNDAKWKATAVPHSVSF